MSLPTSDVSEVIQRLLALEQELTTVVMARPTAVSGPLPANESLGQLKTVIDRLRPLLWIHLNRAGVKHEPDNESAPARAASAG